MNFSEHPTIKELLSFLETNPTSFQVVDSLSKDLRQKGFIQLTDQAPWSLQNGQKYFIERNGSTLAAFIMPLSSPHRVRLLASHTDSPGFKLKPHPEFKKQNATLFGTEVYGAPLLSSWLNRDLGLAGRVLYYDQHQKVQESLIKIDAHPMTIPQIAIHLDREVNEKGLILNKQEHLNVLATLNHSLQENESYLELLLKEKITFSSLIGHDLFLYPLEGPKLGGWKSELIYGYRIDSLASVHAIYSAFCDELTPLDQEIKMILFWDHEEIGSHTAYGAESPFFTSLIERITLNSGLSREEYLRLINNSHCTSVDLAHAVHPNYSEKHDSQHLVTLGSGVILKYSAQHRYSTDARSALPIQIAAKKKDIPLQQFVSRNDTPCGTTIGPIHAYSTGMSTVDIGCAQLSMHSCRELMSSQDHLSMIELLKTHLSSESGSCP